MNTKDLRNAYPKKVITKLNQLAHEYVPALEELVLINKRPADVEVALLFRKRKEFGSRDRRFLSRIIFSYFRWRGWTKSQLKLSLTESFYLSELLEEENNKQWLEFLEQKLPSFKKLSFKNLSLKQKAELISQEFKSKITIENLMPSFFQNHSNDNIEEFIINSQKRPPVWIRSRIDRKILIDAFNLAKLGTDIHLNMTASIKTSSGINLNQKIREHRSKFVIQDLSSQCVGIICMPLAGQIWWDCCAGSGGKSFHLADLMQQQGRILSTDIRESALQELKKRSRIYGIKTIKTQFFNLIDGSQMKHRFDGVLVDAPCSGWGTWGRNPDAKWRTSSDEIKKFASKQLKILSNASVGVKDNGVMIYSVCTVTKEETFEVIESFLKKNSEFFLENFINPLDGTNTNGTLQIYPNNHDGMFIARIRKGGVKDGI